MGVITVGVIDSFNFNLFHPGNFDGLANTTDNEGARGIGSRRIRRGRYRATFPD